MPLRDDPVIRQKIAQLVTEAEVARVLGLRFVAASLQGGAAPTVRSVGVQALTRPSSRARLANASMDVVGPGAQLRVHTEGAPLGGRAESTYRYTVIDTIGGGALGDPEEHHRAPEARAAEELLSDVGDRPGPALPRRCHRARPLDASGRRRAARASSPTTARRW